MPLPEPGIYRHFKGNYYHVIDCVNHSETNEILVLYRPLYGEGTLWVRPLANFRDKGINGNPEVCRFTPVPFDEVPAEILHLIK